MIVELHILQNFAPSNLNRDDTNSPKDCDFGGFRRARISSQCIKRSVRRHPAFAAAVKAAGGEVGIRTKRLKGRLVEILQKEHAYATSDAEMAAAAVIDLLGFKLAEEEKTEYLLYLGEGEVRELARIAASAGEALKELEIAKEKKKKGAVPAGLKEAQDALKSVVAKARKSARSYAADIALFGRMVADNKNMNVDAACQVAHALSTHKVEMEMDYFTAVDDLLPGEDSGSDMIGVVEFNSSCFYRYSAIDVQKLRENLGFNDDLTAAAVKGYVEAAVQAVPTGKQNSMAAQNPAGYVRVIFRKDGFPWSLANAFQRPIRPAAEKSLEETSAEALDSYLQKLKRVYGDEGIFCDAAFNLYDPDGCTFSDLLRQVDKAFAQGGAA